jgi:hypothetical protein
MPRFLRCLCAVALGVGAVGLLGVTAGADDRVRMLTDRDAILRPPTTAVTKSVTPVQGCQVLLDSGDGDCAFVQRADGDFAFTIESGPTLDDVLASRPWTVRVFRPSATVPNGWELALEATPTEGYTGALYAAVTAKVADVTRDGEDELVIGFRSEGTGGILDLDVVGIAEGGAPRVLAHDQLYKGTVVVRADRLVTYTPVYRRSDGNCCPTWIQRARVTFDDGAFRVHPGRRTHTERADVPPGDLD